LVLGKLLQHVYHMYMIRTFIYFPEELNLEIENLAKDTKKSKAAVIREALKEGLTSIKRHKIGGVEAMLKIAELGEKINAKGPRDLSSNMDKYLWGEIE